MPASCGASRPAAQAVISSSIAIRAARSSTKFVVQINPDATDRIRLAVEARQPDAIAPEDMVQRRMQRAEKCVAVGLSLGIRQLCSRLVKLGVHPRVVGCHHLAVLGIDHVDLGDGCATSATQRARGGREHRTTCDGLRALMPRLSARVASGSRSHTVFPSEFRTEVCHTIVDRPRCSAMQSPVMRVPALAAAMNFVLESVVVVRWPSPRFAAVPIAPSVSAKAMIAPPCNTPPTVQSCGRTSISARTTSGATEVRRTPSRPGSRGSSSVWISVRFRMCFARQDEYGLIQPAAQAARYCQASRSVASGGVCSTPRSPR